MRSSQLRHAAARTLTPGNSRPSAVQYDTLADVYDWEAVLEPEGSAAAFDMVLGELSSPGARVLDCAFSRAG